MLGKFEDPLIPEKVDLAFFHDVLHHVDKRAAYLQKVASYVKPSGRIAVIELDATRPDASHRDRTGAAGDERGAGQMDEGGRPAQARRDPACSKTKTSGS